MSELIAEARVLVTPDTAAFRTLLTSQVATAAAGVVVPIAVSPVVTGASAAGATAGLVAQQELLGAAATTTTSAIVAETSALNALVGTQAGATAATRGGIVLASQQEVALEKVARAQLDGVAASKAASAAARQEAVARKQAATAAADQARALGGVTRGAGSAALSFAGLRGATLASTGPFLAGAAAAVAFGKAINIATSFNTEIAVLGATTGATGEDLARAAEAARQFGKDITLPGVTAGDAAKTITEFSKAGLTLSESIAAARGGLQLATAAQIDFGDAVQLSANALNAFGLSGNQAERVADTLANSANLAQGSIEDTALALRQAAAAAEVVGVSFQDTSALLTLLARNGLTGSDAGTSLRTAFLRLVNPSKEANKVLQDLNINLRDIQGNVRPEVFAEFAEAQRNLSVAQQQANAAIVFGQDAFRAFGILAAEGSQGLIDVRAGLAQTGTAAKIAAARMTGLKGATENLSNQLNALGEQTGQVASGPLELLINQLAEYAGGAGDAITKTREFGTALKDVLPTEDLPPGTGFLVDVSKTAFKFGNIVGQINTLKNLIAGGGDEVEEEATRSGVEVRGAIEDASREMARGVAAGFGSEVVGAFQQGFEQINAAIRAGAASTRAATAQAVQGGIGRAGGLEETFDQIVAGGGSQQQQLANLRRQAANQAKIIANAGPDAAGDLLIARRQAQTKLASINSQIVSIEKGIAADRASALAEANRIAEESQREADQAFLGRQADTRAGAERKVQLADETESLQDDIKRRQQLRTLITAQIVALRQSALDEKTKAAAIKALVQAKQQTSDEINNLVRTQAQQNKEQREAAQEEREAANIALGESILDLTGNKNPLLRALDAAIKDARLEKALAKKGSIAFIDAQTEINTLLKRRKDVLEDTEEGAKDAVGGTSLADLFEQANDILKGAGNVGFDAAGLQSLSATPRIQMEVQQRLDIVNDPAKAREARQQQSTDRLIAAIDQLTNAITGNSASGTVTQGPRNRNAWRSMSDDTRFYFQRTAKQMVEQGLVG